MPGLRIRITFNADPDAAFHFNADPDLAHQKKKKKKK
jgi:hypothetical protein